MKLRPQQAARWVRWGICVALAVMIWRGFEDLHFLRIEDGDRGCPELPEGSLVLVRTVEEDGFELRKGSRYLAYLAGSEALRVVRLVGLPGERITVHEGRLLVGLDRVWVRPGDVAWPEVVPAERCLVLVDDPTCPQPDSRTLGPVPVASLAARIVTRLPF